LSKYKCIEVKTKKDKKLFLNFPSTIYSDKYCPQDYKTEKQILNGTHPISSDIEVFPYIVIDKYENVISRCLVTYYKEDLIAYLGFFESLNDINAVKLMMDYIETQIRRDGKLKIIGPIDSSIFINYRFKIDRFDKTYTSEPYNKYYYPDLWKQVGFNVCQKYVSNQLRKVEITDIDARLEKIHSRYIKKNYNIISPTDNTFEKTLEDIYELMMELYSNFPGFKTINKEQFLKLYLPLKNVLNYEMVKLVYDENSKLCAFCVCIPNYEELTKGKLTIDKIFKIREIKKHPEEYVVLYVGSKTNGLGGTLIHTIRNKLYQNRCTSIGALIKEGNITGEMYEDLYIDKFNYVLLEKILVETDDYINN